MFGWRRRNDGFEWREYVRTTILVRRKDRRERIGRAGKAAVDGLKVAGQRGAAAGAMGAQALGRGAKAAGQQGIVIGAAGVRAAEGKLRSGLPRVWDALKAVGSGILAALAVLWAVLWAGASRLARMLARMLARILAPVLAPVLAAGSRAIEPVFSALRQPSIALPLAVAGGVALLGAVGRVAFKGFDRDTLIALVIGLAILLPLLVSRYSDGAPAWLASPLRRAGGGLRRLAGGLGQLGPAGTTVLRRGAIAAVLVIVAGAAWLAWEEVPQSSDLVNLTDDASAVEGRAVALSGDTLRVSRTTLRISGIEAPADGQSCVATKSRRWRCDASAEAALSRLVRSGRVVCAFSGSDDQGNRLATCRIGETDVGAALVRGGHVFATAGLFAPYGSLEREAREAKAGVWSGEALRPSDYRAQKWEEAKRDAPDGCPIKGSVKRGRRIYVLPWTRGYERVRISRSRGDRWFCSEEDARAAGWKPSEQS